MSRGLSTECNNCGKLLRGRSGREFVDLPHITLVGMMSQSFENVDGYLDYYYITEKVNAAHHFCDLTCFNEFAGYREKRYKDLAAKARREDLKREAEENGYGKN